MIPVTVPHGGWIGSMRTCDIGRASMALGAGRESFDDEIDLGVGLILKKRLGERIETGEPLAELHVNDMSRLERAKALLLGAISICDEQPAPQPLIHDLISATQA